MSKPHSLLQTMTNQPVLTIDPTYKLIRIHKVTLQLLKSPAYIQILVNPDKKSMLICEGKEKDHLAHRVDYNKLEDGKCYELYSTPLVSKLLSIIEITSEEERILLYGNYIESLNISVFELSGGLYGKDAV